MLIKIKASQVLRVLKKIKRKGNVYFLDTDELGLPKAVTKEINAILIKKR